MIHYDFIEKVLQKFEGKGISRGYIPCAKGTWYPDSPDKGPILGASGVSVGTGVDLGQQSERGLAEAGITSDLLAKLRPYIGLQKEAAMTALKNKPLNLLADEVTALDRSIHNKYIHETAAMFGKEAFENAPPAVQAVATSLHYQFGTPKRAASPALETIWEFLKSGKYPEAIAALNSTVDWSPNHMAYMSRRRGEAKIIETGIV